MYIVNPKMSGSGVIACIPQEGVCPVGCKECFFQNGRSYLEPLDENVPNIPTSGDVGDCVVRMNDGNDSGNDIDTVVSAARRYKHVFYNTSIPSAVERLPGPVVFTANPGEKAHLFNKEVPANVMFVRVLVNSWNTEVVDVVVDRYARHGIPVVLTFMAYHDKDSIPGDHIGFYERRSRTSNAYYVLKGEKWYEIADRYRDSQFVYTCGKNPMSHSCSRCGNCLREYWHFYDTHRMDGVWPAEPLSEDEVPIQDDIDESMIEWTDSECEGCEHLGGGGCVLCDAAESFCKVNGHHSFVDADLDGEFSGDPE